MTLLGAKNRTAEQIRKTIAKDAIDEELHNHFASVVQMFKSNNSDIIWNAVNRAYIKEGYKLLDGYVDGVKKYYGGELEQVDFTQSEATASKINHFVENVTENRIKDLISADILDETSRMILVNAMYLKADWKIPFDEMYNMDFEFYLDENITKQVEMMRMTSEFAYFETDDFQVLGLPYVGEHVFMYIILPREKFGLGNMLKNLNGLTLAQLLQKREKTTVIVRLPKFKIESSFELKKQLKTLGIVDCFNSTLADFSGMADGCELYVSDVVHKAFIEIYENGTKAAAATGVQMRYHMGESTGPSTIPKFMADHGFLYIITDSTNGNQLFTGVFNG